MKMYAIYDHDGVLNLYSKREVWQWLKAEKRWHVLDKRRKRQEGVPTLCSSCVGWASPRRQSATTAPTGAR